MECAKLNSTEWRPFYRGSVGEYFLLTKKDLKPNFICQHGKLVLRLRWKQKNTLVKGRGTMCEAVEEFAKEYAKEYADNRDVTKVQKLMKNLQFTLDQALDALEIQGDSRTYIITQLQKQQAR